MVALPRGVMAASAGGPRKAQTKYSVDHWGVDQGLLYENLGSMLQSRDGYLWIGADGGVERFDGMKFVVYRMGRTPGLEGDSVRSMQEDSTGALWIGTNRGLARYAHGQFETIFESKTTDYVYALAEDTSTHTMWIGTQRGLRAYRDHRLSAPFDDPLVRRKSIISLLSDSRHRLWIGISGYHGVICYEHGAFRTLATAHTITEHVLSIAETPRGVLWFGTNGDGLVRYDVASGKFTTYGKEEGLAGSAVTALATDANGTLWMAALGLQHLDPETDRIEVVVPVSAPSIRRICCDTEGSVWAASYGDGLMRVRPARYKILDRDGGLPGDFVRSVMQDSNGTIWLSQSGRGAVKIAPDGTITKLIRGDTEVKGDDVLTTWTTRAGDTFLGAQGGLYIWHGGEMRRYPEYRGTRCLFEDSQGRVWFGAYEIGLWCWENGTFTRIALPPELAKTTPCVFAEDRDGALWVGTMNQGLFRVHGSEVTRFTTADVLPNDEIRALYFDRDGNLWVGTKRGLAFLIDGRWYAPAWTRDVVDEHVSGVVEIPNDYLLISTTHGVVRFERKALLDAVRSGQSPTYLPQVTIVEAGRTGSIGAACYPYLWQTSSGEVWIATRKGVAVIDPRKIAVESVVPPVRIEGLTVDGRKMATTGDVEVPAGARQLTIDYSAVTFVRPNRVFFTYQLEGYEDAMVDAGTRRVAFYNSLRPGHYVFRVRSCNSDGVWNNTGATLAFTVLPFFYETWWFAVLAIVVVVAAVIAVFRWRMRVVHRRAEALQAQNAELERRIAERTAELAASLEQLKAAQRDLLESSRLAGMAEVAAGVLHNIGNALNSVNVSADVARNRIRQMKVPSIQRVAQLLSEQGDRLADFITNDPRGRRLPEFLQQMSEHLSAECAMTAQELDALCGGVEHIKTVVAAQQDLTHATEVLEHVAPAELIESALRISAAALARHQVTATRDFQPVPDVQVQRQKTVQILINLINNAKEAMNHTAPADRRLSIAVRAAAGGHIEITVTDNGSGIAPENLTRIFNFGFTTKKNGHGFGLHSSALTAKEMGGELEAFSDGPGRGATFVLRLPAAPSSTKPS